jgi:hypothetical protein
MVTTPSDVHPVAAFPLLADGPHPDLASVDRLFDPFIGSWDLVVSWYADDKPVRVEDGEWHFAWILEGRAVQDVWIVPRRSQRARPDADLYEYGTSLRFPDPDLGGWRSTWIGPMTRAVETFAVTRQADDVVLMTQHEDGRRMRWMFTDIGPTTFTWLNSTEADDGSWTLTQRFDARRMA